MYIGIYWEEDLYYDNKVHSFSYIFSAIYLLTNLFIDLLIYFIVNAMKQSPVLFFIPSCVSLLLSLFIKQLIN